MAPRLDLCNRELLASHLNALVASEIGMPGLDDMGTGQPFDHETGHRRQRQDAAGQGSPFWP